MRRNLEMSKGKIYVVGIGPGNMEDISVRAYKTLKNVDVIAGYITYIDLVKDEFKEKEFYVSGMKKEIDRCEKVLELAKEGKTVALISSGDAGIYGMAGIMIEVALGSGIDVEVIPGITSSVAGASLVGAPLMHDQAIISLSDLLTDWEVITKRIDRASDGDFVISLYNPKSKGRTEQIVEAREIMLKHKAPSTPVALLRHVGREDENYTLTNLDEMLNYEIDMFTVVIVGNSKTYVKEGKMITPRGYHL
jgi:precorrin-3B C17-methyltransferase